MKFTTAFQSLLLACFASVAAAAPAQQDNVVARQAGPSGYVVQPAGGTRWDAGATAGNVGYPGSATLIYQGVSKDFTRNEYTHFETIGIDVYAQLPTLTGPKYYLGRGLAPINGNLTIVTTFLLANNTGFPYDSNYQFRLVIDEYQFATNPGYGEWISFQAAAPLLTLGFDVLP